MPDELFEKWKSQFRKGFLELCLLELLALGERSYGLEMMENRAAGRIQRDLESPRISSPPPSCRKPESETRRVRRILVRTTSADLKIETTSGEVDCDCAGSGARSAVLGKGLTPVSLRTISGDILIRRI
jgi:hypothetical protein